MDIVLIYCLVAQVLDKSDDQGCGCDMDAPDADGCCSDEPADCEGTCGGAVAEDDCGIPFLLISKFANFSKIFFNSIFGGFSDSQISKKSNSQNIYEKKVWPAESAEALATTPTAAAPTRLLTAKEPAEVPSSRMSAAYLF